MSAFRAAFKYFHKKKYKILLTISNRQNRKSILVSCGARLAPFDIAELRELTSYDELELDTLGDRKTALFLIMSDTDATLNFLIFMVYSQLFNLLCENIENNDYEDAIMIATAVRSGIDGIITRDKNHFCSAAVPVYTVDEFLLKLTG